MKKRFLSLALVLVLCLCLLPAMAVPASAASGTMKVWVNNGVCAEINVAAASGTTWYTYSESILSDSSSEPLDWHFKYDATNQDTPAITINQGKSMLGIEAKNGVSLTSLAVFMKQGAMLTGINDETPTIYVQYPLTVTMKGGNTISSECDAICMEGGTAPNLTINMTSSEGNNNTISGTTAAINIVGDEGVSKTRIITMDSSTGGTNTITATGGTAIKVGSASTADTNLNVSVSGENNTISATGGSAIEAELGAITISGTSASDVLTLTNSAQDAAILTGLSGNVSVSTAALQVSSPYQAINVGSMSVTEGNVKVLTNPQTDQYPRYAGITIKNSEGTGLTINNSTVTAPSQEVGVQSSGSITVTGSSSLTATGSDYGIKISNGNASLTVKNASSVTATATGENGTAVYGATATVTDSGSIVSTEGGATLTTTAAGTAFTSGTLILNSDEEVTINGKTYTGGEGGATITYGTTPTLVSGTVVLGDDADIQGLTSAHKITAYGTATVTREADESALTLVSGTITVEEDIYVRFDGHVYTGGSSGAVVTEDTGYLKLSDGSIKVPTGATIKIDEYVYTATTDSTIDINGKLGMGAAVTAPAGATVKVGENTYTAGAGGAAIAYTDDLGEDIEPIGKLTNGTVTIDTDSSILVGNKTITSADDNDVTISVDENGGITLVEGSLAVPVGDKIIIDGLEYTAYNEASTGTATVTVSEDGASTNGDDWFTHENENYTVSIYSTDPGKLLDRGTYELDAGEEIDILVAAAEGIKTVTGPATVTMTPGTDAIATITVPTDGETDAQATISGITLHAGATVTVTANADDDENIYTLTSGTVEAGSPITTPSGVTVVGATVTVNGNNVTVTDTFGAGATIVLPAGKTATIKGTTYTGAAKTGSTVSVDTRGVAHVYVTGYSLTAESTAITMTTTYGEQLTEAIEIENNGYPEDNGKTYIRMTLTEVNGIAWSWTENKEEAEDNTSSGQTASFQPRFADASFPNAGTYTINWTAEAFDNEEYTGEAKFTLSGTLTLTVEKIDLANATLELTGGNSKQLGQNDITFDLPELTVTVDDSEVTAENNYTIKWTDSNNAEVTDTTGIEASKAGVYTATVTGTGNYKGSNTIQFAVSAEGASDASSATVTVATCTYNGEEQKPTVTVTLGDAEIDAANYVLTYANNINASENTATVTVTFGGAYYGTATQTFTIEKKAITKPTEDTTTYTYNGGQQTYGVAATDDYTVNGGVQKDAGEYTVAIGLTDTSNTEWSDSTIDALNYTFKIHPKTVTVKAKDQSIYVGGTAPDLTSPTLNTHYTITGLVGSDTLEFTTITMVYQQNGQTVTPDTSAAGTYDIVITATTSDPNYTITTANGTLTVRNRSTDSTGGYTPPVQKVTVPISGDENTIHVDVSVSGSKATVDDVDLDHLDTVIGDDVQTGTVTIDFSGLNKSINTVEIPSDVVKQIAEAVNDPANDAHSFEIILSDGTSIEFDAVALSEKAAQADGLDITISIKTSRGTGAQQSVVGSRPAYDINVTSGGEHISDMGGMVTVHAPYELKDGELPRGIIVYYVDDNGNKEACVTSYDPIKKRVNWKTDHLSLYMIDYDESLLNPFTDVSEDAYYFDSVLWAVDEGITKGTSETTFSPDASCTRAQMATFLWRAAGSPDPVGSTNPFTDVSADAYYAKAVQWAVEQGITNGTSETTFSPDADCTRAQMATFLWRNAGSPAPAGDSNPFADVSADAYYAEAVQWAVEQGITNGTSETTFSPDADCTRGQMVTFLYRFFVK